MAYGAVVSSWGEADVAISLWASPHRMVIPGNDTRNESCRTWVCDQTLRTWQQLKVSKSLQPPGSSFPVWFAAQRCNPAVNTAIVQFKRVPDYLSFSTDRNLGRDIYSKTLYDAEHPRPAPPNPPVDLRPSNVRQSSPLGHAKAIFVVTIFKDKPLHMHSPRQLTHNGGE